jgi:NAD(P)-dependent dehydrogenase (short-subunit alcohol dehydrogenase family)
MESRRIMITGANAGIGKNVAKQLALINTTEKIYLACRDGSKAAKAKNELEQQTGRSIFEIIVMDLNDLTSVRAAVSSLTIPIDALLMNAGGSGGKTPLTLTKDGVTTIFATNVLGHVVLLEELLKAKKLNNIALFVGSEAARGIPKMGLKRPALKTSSVDEFASIINGKYFNDKKFNSLMAYGQVKYIGAMWMASLSRKNPSLRFITMSPGSTQGTETASDFPKVFQFIYNKVMMPIILPLMGMAHSLDKGTKRIVDGIFDNTLKSGVFYASKEKVLTGPIIDQSEIFPDLNNETLQDNAYEAVHRFIG